jgi:isopenicillin N synthase-like dioxygenase
VIDLSAWNNSDEATQTSLAHAIDDAYRNTGFVYLINHGIEGELTCRCFAQSRNFVRFSDQQKFKVHYSKSGFHRGYIPPRVERPDPQAPADVKEAFDIGLEVTSCDPGDPAARMRSQNLWPVDLKEFRETVSEYFSQALVLSNTIFAILSTALGLPSDFFVGLRMTDQLIGLMMLGFKAQLIRESNPP